jgi:hypothetical protein
VISLLVAVEDVDAANIRAGVPSNTSDNVLFGAYEDFGAYGNATGQLADDASTFSTDEQDYNEGQDTSYANPLLIAVLALARDCPKSLADAQKYVSNG